MIEECNFKGKAKYELEKIGTPEPTERELEYYICRMMPYYSHYCKCEGEENCVLYQTYKLIYYYSKR